MYTRNRNYHEGTFIEDLHSDLPHCTGFIIFNMFNLCKCIRNSVLYPYIVVLMLFNVQQNTLHEHVQIYHTQSPQIT